MEQLISHFTWREKSKNWKTPNPPLNKQRVEAIFREMEGVFKQNLTLKVKLITYLDNRLSARVQIISQGMIGIEVEIMKFVDSRANFIFQIIRKDLTNYKPGNA